MTYPMFFLIDKPLEWPYWLKRDAKKRINSLTDYRHRHVYNWIKDTGQKSALALFRIYGVEFNVIPRAIFC